MPNELYFPRCAAACQPDASFCRSCGLQLAAIGAIVRGESPLSKPDRFRPNSSFIRAGMGLFMLGLVLALGSAALRSFNIFPEELSRAVFLGFITLGMACIGLGFVFPNRGQRKTHSSASAPEMIPASTTSQLPEADLQAANAAFSMPRREPAMSQPGSVTESTTRHLKQEN